MPLRDFILTLNASARDTPTFFHRKGLDHPFVALNDRVFIHYANIRLESHFLPIIDTHSGKLHGHAASIRAYGLSNNIAMPPDAVFVLPSNDEEFIYLDRLIRTLHALNYLTRPAHGNLLLRVHPRHVLSVPANHGLAFEEILRPCGLFPSQITLEIDINAIEDKPHFIRAAESYRSRGYGIAVGQFGRSHADIDFLQALNPDLVRIAPSLQTGGFPEAALIDSIHRIGAQVIVDSQHSDQRRHHAAAHGIDLLQALPFALPEGRLRPAA